MEKYDNMREFKELILMLENNWNMQVHSLTIFRHVLDDDVFCKFLLLCDSMQEDLSTKVDRYCTFVSSLYQNDTDFSAYLYRWLMNDENTVIHRISEKKVYRKHCRTVCMQSWKSSKKSLVSQVIK